MKCPYCSVLDNKVIDSRLSQGGEVIRRRRECSSCNRRYTTYERIEESLPLIVKKDGRREPFDHSKLVAGLKKACEKRPISTEQVESTIDQIERDLIEAGHKEIASTQVGELVMEKLKSLDEVAYVRFASVYRRFRDAQEFMDELSGLVRQSSQSSNPSKGSA